MEAGLNKDEMDFVIELIKENKNYPMTIEANLKNKKSRGETNKTIEEKFLEAYLTKAEMVNLIAGPMKGDK